MKPQQVLLPQQKQVMNPSMLQFMHILQLPQLELAEWVQAEIEKNPLLEEEREESYSDTSFLFTPRVEELADFLPTAPTLFDHLMIQAREAFSNAHDLEEAERIIGNLNDRGFMEEPCDALILAILQTFDPPGIGARNLAESLTLQLRQKGRARSPAIPLLAKPPQTLTKQEKEVLREEIRGLSFNPAAPFHPQMSIPLHPDLTIRYLAGTWKIELNEAHFPKVKLVPFDQPTPFYARGKWVIKMLKERKRTLKRIVRHIIRKQRAFFSQESREIAPLSMREISASTGYHLSTISRAVQEKIAATPLGIYPLAHFFSQGISQTSGKKISSKTLQEMIASLTHQETKEAPLSDEAIARYFKEQGLTCARRTIAKYRKLLRIPTARIRGPANCRYF